MSREIYLTMFIAIVALFFGAYFLRSQQNMEIPTGEISIGKVVSALRNINSRLDFLEKKYSLDKEQSERFRKNILDGMSLATEARRIDNIAVTGLLDRHASLPAGGAAPAPH